MLFFKHIRFIKIKNKHFTLSSSDGIFRNCLKQRKPEIWRFEFFTKAISALLREKLKKLRRSQTRISEFFIYGEQSDFRILQNSKLNHYRLKAVGSISGWSRLKRDCLFSFIFESFSWIIDSFGEKR